MLQRLLHSGQLVGLTCNRTTFVEHAVVVVVVLVVVVVAVMGP